MICIPFLQSGHLLFTILWYLRSYCSTQAMDKGGIDETSLKLAICARAEVFYDTTRSPAC